MPFKIAALNQSSSAVGGSPYQPVYVPQPAATQKKGGGGGILGFLGREGSAFEHNVVDTIHGLPTGLEMLGTSVYDAATGNFKPIEQLGRGFVKGVETDIRHPLRNPLNTIMDLTMFAGGAGAIGGRVAELGRIATGSETAAETAINADRVAAGLEPIAQSRNIVSRVGHAVIHGTPTPKRPIRFTNAQGEVKEVSGLSYSRNPAIRAGQKLVDQVHEMYPNFGIKGIWRSQSARVNKALFQKLTATKMISRADANYIIKRWGGKPDAVQEAVAIIHRGTTADAQLAKINEILQTAKGAQKAVVEKWKQATIDAKPLLETYEHTTSPTVIPAAEGATRTVLAKAAEEKTIPVAAKSPFIADHLARNPETAAFVQGGKAVLTSERYDQLLADAERVARGEPTPAFTPSTEWQTVPEGTVIPPGAEVRMNMQGGPSEARWDNPPPAAAAKPPSAGMRNSARAVVNKLKAAGRPSEAVMREEPMPDYILHPGGTYTLSRPLTNATGKLAGHVQDVRNMAADIKAAVDRRTKELQDEGVLDPVSAMIRNLGPKNVIEGNGLIPNLRKMQTDIRNLRNLGHTDHADALQRQLDSWSAHMEGLRGAAASEHQTSLDLGTELGRPSPIEDPELAKMLARIPEEIAPRKSIVDNFRRPWRGADPTLPPELTHAYTGAVLSHGLQNLNVAHVVAGTVTDAQRFVALRQLRRVIVDAALETPKGIPRAYRMPILLDNWRGPLPMNYHYASRLMNKEGDLTPEENAAGGRLFDTLRDLLTNPEHVADYLRRTFQEPSPQLRWAQGKADAIAFQTEKDLEIHPIPGVGWIDRRWLGGMDKQNPIWSAMERPGVRKFVKVTDAVNDAQKMSVLYLKTSYLLPNLIGNIGLALVQQGFLMPKNLARASLLMAGKGYSRDVQELIKAAAGGGFSRSIGGAKEVSARIRAINNWFADKYGKVIDDPLRIASVIHEAAADGFVTDKELRALFTDPALESRMVDVINRANDAMLNYERLGPGESAILRRMVFFYPFLKGSYRYATRLPIERPIQAGVLYQGGVMGHEQQQRLLGELPPWLSQLIPIHGGASVINPQSAQVVETPADLVEALANAVSGHPVQGIDILQQNLSPADSFLYTFLTGHTTVPQPATMNNLKRAFTEVFGGEPWYRFYKSLEQSGQVPTRPSVYAPDTVRQAMLRYLLTGGLTPRTFNKAQANIEAQRAYSPTGYTS